MLRTIVIQGSRTLTLYWDPSKGKRKIHDSSSSQFLSFHNCTGDQPTTDPSLAIPVVSTYWEHLNFQTQNYGRTQKCSSGFVGKNLLQTPVQRKGTCTVRVIHPVFFLFVCFVLFSLPGSQGDMLSLPLDKDLKHQGRWSVKIAGH